MSSDRNRDSAGTALSDGEIIDRFGGIRPMAAKLGVAFTTVQGWKVRGRIPEGRRQAILDAAGSHGIDLGGAVAPAESPAPGREAKPVTDAPAPEPAPEQPPEPPRKESAQPETHAGEPPGGAEPGTAPVAKFAPPPRGNAGIAWLALLVALAVGVALVARPWWEPLVFPLAPAPGGSAQSAETVAEIRALSRAVERLSGDLAGRLETLEGRIAAVERTGGGGGDLGPQLAALERSLASLASGLESISATLSGFEARIGTLELASTADSARVESALRESAAALAALRQELATLGDLLTASRADTNKALEDLREGLAATLEHAAALRARVGELESRPVQTGEKIAALALAVGQVEAAFDSGRPYRSALNRLEAIARDDPLILESGAIAALAPWADRGIDSRSTLQRRFARIAPDITAALAKTDSVTWIDRIWDSVSTIVTVRRVEGSEDLSPVSRAEAALANDDLAAAAAAFKGLESLGEAGDAWLAMAERRIRAEREIAALYAQVIQPLAGPAPAAGSRETAAPDTGFGESAAQ